MSPADSCEEGLRKDSGLSLKTTTRYQAECEDVLELGVATMGCYKRVSW